jgi:hypothetical protein
MDRTMTTFLIFEASIMEARQNHTTAQARLRRTDKYRYYNPGEGVRVCGGRKAFLPSRAPFAVAQKSLRPPGGSYSFMLKSLLGPPTHWPA